MSDLEHEIKVTLTYDQKDSVQYVIKTGDIVDLLRKNEVCHGLDAFDELPFVLEEMICRELMRKLSDEQPFFLDGKFPGRLYTMCKALVHKIGENLDER